MSRVGDWFGYFAMRHWERHPRDDWPRLEEARDFYRGWIANLVLIGVTEDVADEASERMMADPPKFRDGHVNAMVASCKAIFKERAAKGEGIAPDGHEAALLAARGCDDCGGSTGLATRFRRVSRGTTDDRGHARPDAVVFYCRCALGRWLGRNHREGQPEIHRRIPDLEDHPFLWGYDYRERPAGPPPPPPEPAPRRDRMPHLDAPAPTVGEVAGRYVRRNPGGTVEEAPIY